MPVALRGPFSLLSAIFSYLLTVSSAVQSLLYSQVISIKLKPFSHYFYYCHLSSICIITFLLSLISYFAFSFRITRASALKLICATSLLGLMLQHHCPCTQISLYTYLLNTSLVLSSKLTHIGDHTLTDTQSAIYRHCYIYINI